MVSRAKPTHPKAFRANVICWAVLEGLDIEQLRRILRARPDLAALGEQLSPVRLLTAEDFNAIARELKRVK